MPKISFLDLPIIVGRPKYFIWLSTNLIPNTWHNWVSLSSEIARLNETSNLSRLIFFPDSFSKIDKRLVMDVHSEIDDDLANKRLSSVKKRWEIRGPLRLSRIGWIGLLTTAFLIKAEILVHKRKSQGDIGSPYRRPLLGSTKPLRCPLIKKEKEIVVKQDIINLIKWGGKSILTITHSK